MTLDNDSKGVIIRIMDTGKRYTIDQLGELTGFSRRTIRFYVERALVEPPAGRGRGGFYGESQLLALRRIAEARREGRSLASVASAGPGAGSAAPGEPERILRWELAPGVRLDVAEEAWEHQRDLLAALLRVAGLAETGVHGWAVHPAKGENHNDRC